MTTIAAKSLADLLTSNELDLVAKCSYTKFDNLEVNTDLNDRLIDFDTVMAVIDKGVFVLDDEDELVCHVAPEWEEEALWYESACYAYYAEAEFREYPGEYIDVWFIGSWRRTAEANAAGAGCKSIRYEIGKWFADRKEAEAFVAFERAHIPSDEYDRLWEDEDAREEIRQRFFK